MNEDGYTIFLITGWLNPHLKRNIVVVQVCNLCNVGLRLSIGYKQHEAAKESCVARIIYHIS